MQHLIRVTKTEIACLHPNWDWRNHYMLDFLSSRWNWDPWINSQVWLICIKWMKLIGYAQHLQVNQSKEGHPRGCPWGCGEERPPIVLGPYVTQSLTLGAGVGGGVHAPVLRLGWECWDMGLDAQYGRARLSSSGSRGQRQCSGVLMSDLRKMVKEDGGREVRKMKERHGRGEWQRENCKALREWRLRPVSPR